MKYLIIICALLLLTGCNQQEKKQEPIVPEVLSSSVPVTTGLAQFTESELSSGTYLGGIYTPIFISSNTLIVSGVFSLSIPKEIINKAYSSQYTPVTKSYYEWIGFTNQDKKKTFTIHISKLIWPETTYTSEDLCLVEYYDGFLSKSETTKTIQGRKIYIYYATLKISGLDMDVKPWIAEDMQFCFVDSGMLYKFSASNYTHEYMEGIINSFKFLD